MGCSECPKDCPDIKVVSLVFSVDVGYGKDVRCVPVHASCVYLFSLLFCGHSLGHTA